jgi:hypothetical protein
MKTAFLLFSVSNSPSAMRSGQILKNSFLETFVDVLVNPY